jgi:hypothetical protein
MMEWWNDGIRNKDVRMVDGDGKQEKEWQRTNFSIHTYSQQQYSSSIII